VYGKLDEPDFRVFKGFDPWAIPLMALFLGSLQYLLEEGSHWGWFESEEARITAAVCTVAGAGFLWRSVWHPQPVVDLRICRSHRFAMACLFQFMLGMILFTSIYLIPQFLAQVRGFRSLEIGRAVFVTGIFQLLSTPLVAIASRRMDPRHMPLFGFLLLAASMHMTAELTSLWGGVELFWPQALRGFAMMFCIVPATNMALGDMPSAMIKEASGFSNLMRSLGGAVGIALASTALNDRYRLHYSRLAETLNDRNPAVQEMLVQLNAITASTTTAFEDRYAASLSLLNKHLNRGALTLGFADCFVLLTGVCLLATLLLSITAKPSTAMAHGNEAH